MVASSARRGSLVSYLLCAGLVALLAAGNYLLWIHNYFAADSWTIVGSVGLSAWNLADLLPFRQAASTVNAVFTYAPVLRVMTWLAFKLGGYNPEPYHLLLIAFHVGTSLLLFATALQLTGSRLKATAAGAIFAVHFASTEGVGWFAGGSHAIAGFFGATALVLYTRYLVTRRTLWQVGALAALLGGALTQATALPWFAILACLDIFHSRKTGDLRGLHRRLAILAALLVAIIPVYLQALDSTGRSGYSYQLGPWVFRNLLHYPLSTVMPSLEGSSYSLARDLLPAPFDRDAFTRLMGMTEAFGILLATGLLVVAVVLLWTRGGWLSRFCVVSFALGTTPYLLINGQGYRYLYGPLIFFSLVAANSVVDLYRHLRVPSPVAAMTLLAILPLFVALSFAESQRQLFWWQQAGLVAHRSLQQLRETQPRFPGGAKILFGGLPDTLQNTNAQVWRQGIPDAVRAVYGDPTLRVEAYGKEEVERLFRQELRGAPDTFGFVWENWQFRRVAP